MEKIKVNMSPNPLDVQTIHASQNDGEARQWEFELHNNGELIDTSDVKEQMVFKAYKGGTEQLLPENGSTPTTSPFLGDIKYPQGLLTDQKFTYRQSPTEEDGLAKITDIKGNTLVWNQQIDASLYNTGTYSDVAVTKSTDETYLIANGTASATAYIRLFKSASSPTISGHKYCCVVPTDSNVAYYDDSSPRQYSQQFSSFMFTSNGSPIRPYVRIDSGVASTNRRISFMMFDLTQMGLDITDPSDFTTLFPLSYYSYNQGSLLSFNGEQLKTVGKNQFNSEHAVSATNVVESNDNGTITIKDVSSLTWSNAYIGYSDVIAGKEYTIKASLKYGRIGGNLSGTSYPIPDNQPDTNIGSLIFAAVTSAIPSRTFIPNFTGRIYWWYCTDINNANRQQFAMQPMLSTTDADFEPYTSSTLSLPISTYFPNGMDGVGTDYDELTNTKASTRMTRVDLGSLDWTKESRQNRFNSRALADAKVFPSDSVANAICDKYIIVSSNDTYLGNDGLSIDSGGRVNIHDTAYTSATASDFKTAMSGVYLVYPLATPTETSFTTASLVTENAEIPLSNEDGVLIGKCTEQLSAEPGFHDAKIKLSDADGECYSNKIQLHIERKPS